MLLGDVNCRYAGLQNAFLNGKKELQPGQYAEPLDTADRPNENAKIAVDILSPLVLINGLEVRGRQFSNSLTFRQRSRGWIWQLDHCYVSSCVVPALLGASVNQDPALPSNHASLFCTFSRRVMTPTY